MNKVIHFEIPFDDKERAKKFYGETFGWEFDEIPEINYTGIKTTPTDETSLPLERGVINGGLTERAKDTPTPVITIEVDSIDDYVKKVESAGGQSISPKGEVPQMGYYAYVKDSEGNVIGLWENI